MIEYKEYKAENLSDFVKAKVAQKEMSLSKLARMCNTYPQYLSQALLGRKDFTDRLCNEVSKNLELSDEETFFLKILQSVSNKTVKIDVSEKSGNYVANLLRMRDNTTTENIN